MDDAAKSDLLRVLDIYGQEFLNRFSSLGKFKFGEPSSDRASQSNQSRPSSVDFEEWHGIGHRHEETISEEEALSDEDNGGRDNDDFTMSTAAKLPPLVVFEDARAKNNLINTNVRSRSFMSSKISRLREDVSVSSMPETLDDEFEEEKTNAQNDAALHRLIHTKLLSGSRNPELNLTSAERRRALNGRVLELTGQAKLGRGEIKIQIAERNKAAKRVREGLIKKQKERERKQLEEAKDLGNYHPSIKKMFQRAEDTPSRRKKRIRGLRMGVGKFSAGILRLSKQEITAVQGSTRGHSRGGRSGKGRLKSAHNTVRTLST